MNGHGSGRPATFELNEDSALAWYFVFANWPERTTRPIFRLASSPMMVAVGADPESFEILDRTVRLALDQPGPLASSGRALLAAISGHPAANSRSFEAAAL